MRLPRRMQRGAPVADDVNGVRPLRPEDISRLHLRNHPQLDDGDAEARVIQLPGLSMWHPDSGEFILTTPWRHRMDIPTASTISAMRHDSELLEASVAEAERRGHAAFILMETFERRPPQFYARNNMQHLESILTYEHKRPFEMVRDTTPRDLEFVPYDGLDAWLGEQILKLDHQAFPWLWQNSVGEFAAYLRMPFTELWAGLLDGKVVCYFGVTHFRRWSHLDRIAIRPALQGQGLGRQALKYAVERMLTAGAERVALSTQRANHISRQMYEGVGFAETEQNHYDIYGILFAEGRAHMREIPNDERSDDE